MLNTDRPNSPPTARPARRPQVRPAAEPTPLHPPFPSQRYGLIYADPPWHYDGDPNKDQAAGKHYPLMRNPDIAALPVGSITAPKAACPSVTQRPISSQVLSAHVLTWPDLSSQCLSLTSRRPSRQPSPFDGFPADCASTQGDR